VTSHRFSDVTDIGGDKNNWTARHCVTHWSTESPNDAADLVGSMQRRTRQMRKVKKLISLRNLKRV